MAYISRKRKTGSPDVRSRPLQPKQETTSNQDIYHNTVYLIYSGRILILALGILIYLYSSDIQIWINQLWQRLLLSPIYYSSYFETLFTTFCYAVIIALYPFILKHIHRFDKYKVDPSVTYQHQTIFGMTRNAIIYMLPLATLDTFIVKKYFGVDQQIWKEKSMFWIQTTRALPEMPPTLVQLVVHLIASILLFDFIFFFIHLTLHRNIWLFKTFHRYHHDHDVLHPHITDQLTVGERLALILSANFALKCFNSHPLTRTLFIPVFVYLLIENHTGYDLPIGIHRIVPFGILSGPVKHYNHHINGERNYQPFLNYMDYFYQKSKRVRLF